MAVLPHHDPLPATGAARENAGFLAVYWTTLAFPIMLLVLPGKVESQHL